MKVSKKSILAQKRHLGQNIRRIREYFGMKQSTLASTLGVSQQTISKIEQEKELSDKDLERLASAMNIDSKIIKNFNSQNLLTIPLSANSMPADGDFELYEKIIQLYTELIVSERQKHVILDKIAEMNS